MNRLFYTKKIQLSPVFVCLLFGKGSHGSIDKLAVLN